VKSCSAPCVLVEAQQQACYPRALAGGRRLFEALRRSTRAYEKDGLTRSLGCASETPDPGGGRHPQSQKIAQVSLDFLWEQSVCGGIAKRESMDVAIAKTAAPEIELREPRLLLEAAKPTNCLARA